MFWDFDLFGDFDFVTIFVASFPQSKIEEAFPHEACYTPSRCRVEIMRRKDYGEHHPIHHFRG
jgi:hypothetical protein